MRHRLTAGLVAGILGLLAPLLAIPAAAQEGPVAAPPEEAPVAAEGVVGSRAPEPGDAGRTVVFLVRHAETEADGTRDPALSTVGRARAARLGAVLEDAGLEAVHTTDYARTRGTAAPVAEGLGMEPRIYDPTRPERFAASLRERGGRTLVVGHSNTTPELVAALGGEPGAPIDESEHDRLYVLFTDGDEVRTVLLRY